MTTILLSTFGIIAILALLVLADAVLMTASFTIGYIRGARRECRERDIPIPYTTRDLIRLAIKEFWL